MSAEQAPDPTDKLLGVVLANRYQIEVRLGEGAMGAVYRAKHVKVGRPFAVKILHKKLLEDKKVAQRFEREAELAGRLRHPNVVGVVDVGETPDGLRYMVMDFAEGDDLATMLNEAPMRPERVLHLTRQMLEGLYHAHEAGLIHRDFKPENVIIEKDDHGAEIPRIVDFGIAILRDGGDSAGANGRLTTNGLVLGTPHYMAPEQAVADPIDHRIDLFALGIVVYEMLSGKLPFDGTGAEVARANLLLDPPLISQRVPYLEVDPLLEAFARRMMAKKRDLRPATAKAAREILDLIERDRPAAAAALGVPLSTVRAPQVTQDVTPHRRVNEDTGDHMVPTEGPAMAVAAASFAHIPTHGPRATDLEAPPVPHRRSEASITTSPAEPLLWGADGEEEPRPPRRRWIIATLGAAVAAAAIVVVVLSRTSDDQKKPKAVEPEQKVTMQAIDPTPPPTPPPSQPAVVDDSSAKAVVPPVEPPVDKTAKVKKPDHVAKVKQQPVKVVDKTPVKVPEKTPEIVKTVEKTPEVKADGITSNALVAQYSSVGRDLKALGDKASDLWPRYRMIQLNNALATPAKRSETSTLLSQLSKAAASRK